MDSCRKGRGRADCTCLRVDCWWEIIGGSSSGSSSSSSSIVTSGNNESSNETKELNCSFRDFSESIEAYDGLVDWWIRISGSKYVCLVFISLGPDLDRSYVGYFDLGLSSLAAQGTGALSMKIGPIRHA